MTTSYPIFIHSMWRTGSTYLFSRFRANSKYYCYQEPLHEFIAELSPENVTKISSESMGELLRHPYLERPYFDEFVPLYRSTNGSVENSSQYFAIHTFFSETDDKVNRYLASLTDYAVSQNKQPVLQFCRSYGRLRGLRDAFPGRHVYLVRNPRDQWMSFLSHRDTYFMSLTCAIASLRENAGVLSSILKTPLIPRAKLLGRWKTCDFQNVLRVARAYEASLSLVDKYRIFYFEWCAACRAGAQHCDVSLDVNQLSRRTAARRQAEKAFDIDLSDCNMPTYDEYLLPEDLLYEIELQVEKIGNFPAFSQQANSALRAS